MFDVHYIIDTLIGIVLAMIAFIAAQFNKRLDDHDDRLSNLPETYARRDDVRDMFQSIQASLVRIEERQAKKDA